MRGLWLALLLVSCSPVVTHLPRQPLAVMSALPLFWGEGGPTAVLQGGDQRAAITRQLAQSWDLRPIDRLDASALQHMRVLLLAQPRGLSPDELVALDAWVRGGGRVIIFADPMLLWPSALPLGDKRRAPLITLLDPLLSHWGLTLDGGVDGAEALLEVDGKQAVGAGMGRWKAKLPGCKVSSDARWVTCQIGKGRALLVADADVLDLEDVPENREAVDALFVRLASK